MARKPTASTKSKATDKPAAKGAAQSAGSPKRGRSFRGGVRGTGYTSGQAKDKHLVIVESPAKAKTINKYLGSDYVVLASVGHIRDLPSKSAKGKKEPVPGVDLENQFAPTYEVLDGKDKVVSELKQAAKDAMKSGHEVWFATDLDREGEAIAWHLSELLGIDPSRAKRVMFAAITKSDIQKAFQQPLPIDMDKVSAQQARRIVDRIVGYQVSPLLWKKVARGLSAGRVQSVAVRLIVEREREIRAFMPDEYWNVLARFALSERDARELMPAWASEVARRDEKGKPPTQKSLNAWLAANGAFTAELVEIDGVKFDVSAPSSSNADLADRMLRVAREVGLVMPRVTRASDAQAKGRAKNLVSLVGDADPKTPYAVTGVDTKRTTSRPPPPLITSTMQQSASTWFGFAAQRTMRAAQQLYEGVEVPGEGPVGLITYMRTDSTHISKDAVDAVRGYIGRTFGDGYLPASPNSYTSSNKAAQEAHEAIRPASLEYPPQRVQRSLTPDQYKLYTLIWERFVACQMSPAQWDSTTVTIEGGRGAKAVFKATGRVLVFDGFYRVLGVPVGDEQNMPKIAKGKPVSPFSFECQQKFTQPPSRYSEASLIKTLEAEGIGRPSTYAEIISKIQERNYVEQVDRRFFATDLGEVVTDKLVEAFPTIMDIGYTREMEGELDKVEDDHLDWRKMLERFYEPFVESLGAAEENLRHAKAEIVPAPPEYKCEKCGAPLVYRFGKNGRFLSCSTYPECKYAAPVDREGRPRQTETVNIKCPVTGRPMVKRTGRFGPFLATLRAEGEPADAGIILNIDKKGKVTAPSPPPLETDLKCPTCESALNLRNGARGPWLGCSRFPKCRGRGKWTEVPEAQRAELERALAAHEKQHPVPIITTLDGTPLTDKQGRPLATAPTVDQLARSNDSGSAGGGESADAEYETVA